MPDRIMPMTAFSFSSSYSHPIYPIMKRLFASILFTCCLPTAFLSAATPVLLKNSHAVQPGIEKVEAVQRYSVKKRLTSLLDDELFDHSQVALYVYDLTDNELLFAHNEKQRMRPASTEKIVTAVAALYHLGADYQFSTDLYVQELGGGKARVWIRGGYDPLFDASDLEAMVQQLKRLGVKSIDGAVRLDVSMKDSKQWGWGWCWDDDEVPLTPLLYRNKDEFVSRMTTALNSSGLAWNGFTKLEKVPADVVCVCRRSHPIDGVLHPMMKDSDNSMAESLFYQLAAASKQDGAGRKQAVRRIHTVVEATGLNPDDYQFADGSGLSLYNYLSAELLGRLLAFAYRNPDIYDPLLRSLPIAGTDGTLRRRMQQIEAAGNVRAKTGSVEGVSSLAGYCTAPNGHTLCFSILNQGVSRLSMGRRFQDKVCEVLCTE